MELLTDVPLIYLLGLSALNWPNNCKISCYGYADNNEFKKVVDKVMSC